MTTQHTPTNLLAVGSSSREYISGTLLGRDCVIYEEGGHDAEQAAFIVRACNAHEELLAAVKNWSNWIDRQPSGVQASALGLFTGTMAAIAKAEDE